MVNECGSVAGMRIGRGIRSAQRIPPPVPLCPQYIPHDLTWDLTPAAMVRSPRLIAWAVAWPVVIVVIIITFKLCFSAQKKIILRK
jgi:hypothetical protein